MCTILSHRVCVCVCVCVRNVSWSLPQGSDDVCEVKEKTFWQKFKEIIPFGGGSPELGQGLAKQVGNVTECALLGFLCDLGKSVTA